MTAREYLENEVKRHAAAAKAVTAKAEAESRELSAEERAEVEASVAKAGEAKARIKEIDDRKALNDAIDGVALPTNADVSEADPSAKSLGEAFVKSEGYKALKSRGMAGTWTTGPVEFGQKLNDGGSPAASVESITGAGGTLPLQPQVAPLVPPAEQKLYVADLFGAGVATQNTIVYLEETTTQAGAHNANPYNDPNLPATAVVTSEGAPKPAAFVDFTKKSISIEKIAAFLPIADEMLEDEPQIASYINGRLAIFVRQAEEAYLMAKLLAAPGLGSADNSDVEGDNLFDAIAAGIMSVQIHGGLEPDALIINPVDFWTMSVLKATGGTGVYFSGGPYAGPARNPWGLRTVVTQAVAAGSPIVGAFREASTLWRKGGLSVEASNSHADYFRKNLTALRAEERLGLAVYRPKAFAEVSVVS